MRALYWLFIGLSTVFSTGASSGSLPDGLLIVAYDGKSWNPYVVEKDRELKKLRHISDPVDVTWNASTETIYYRSSDGAISYNSLGVDTVSGQIKSLAATQLRANKAGLTWVELQDGRSSNTSLKAYSQATHKEVQLFEQASAQFHPVQYGRTLFYSHVSCRQRCRPLIQDVWRYDFTSGMSEQLTMLNGVTYLHSVSSDSRKGYISSNARGYYNIAELDLYTKQVSWVSTGAFTDTWPSVDRFGNVYFVRKDHGDSLMVLNKSTGKTSKVELPGYILKIRYLEISQ